MKHLSRDEKREEWLVHYIDHAESGFKSRERIVRAKYVILGAGSLGSTNILLQSKKNGLALSSNVGKHFSTTGDNIGFSVDGKQTVNSLGVELQKLGKRKKGPGPTITTVIDLRRPDKPLEENFILEDGTPPCSADKPYEFLLAGAEVGQGEVTWREIVDDLDGKAWKNSLAFLGMSNDDARGELKLDDQNGRVWVSYPGVGDERNFEAMQSGMEVANDALGGKYLSNPLWGGLIAELRDKKALISVHPIGGCPMGEDGKGGVVNHAGQVFKGDTDELYQGLYVVDGAIMPRCLGVNPSLTISMVAERCMRLMGDQLGWNIDYKKKSGQYFILFLPAVSTQ